jgi:hypothetical protein
MIHGSVGVSVDVRIIVGDGERVAVLVKRSVWVGMAIKVGEEYGLRVSVGSINEVGGGWATNVNPPHPMDKRVKKSMRTKALLILTKDD